MKRMFFDLETTGVKHWQNGIHQLSGLIEIDGEVKEFFNFKVQPYHLAVIDPVALAASRTKAEDLPTYRPMGECHKELTGILSKYVNKYDKKDKFFLIGYNNAGFDNAFLRAWFSQCGDDFFGSYFWAGSIDVMVLAAHLLASERHKMIDFKQGTVARYLGIVVDSDRLHDAQYDVEILREIFYRLNIL